MRDDKRIPIVIKDAAAVKVSSGNKFETEQGFTAIKNGIKQTKKADAVPLGRKPEWLKIKLPSGGKFQHNFKAERRLSPALVIIYNTILSQILNQTTD